MKKIALLVVMLFGMVSYNQAQKLSKEEVARYDTEVRALLKYLEETLNFIGDTTTTAQEKGIVFSESWSKIFIDDKVQVEDDLDNNRNMPINKDVQAYLKDIDFFFKKAHFDFDIQSIANSTRDDGTVYFKASLSRHLVAQTINDEKVDNIKNRFVEINLDRQKSSLKIASIYTTKINQEEALRNWWNALSGNWKARLGKDIIPDGYVPEDQADLDKKLKLIAQRQSLDMSNLPEIINLEPVDMLSDLTFLDISGTSIDDISALRGANKLKTLKANSTLIEDLTPLKYAVTLEELEVANTNVENLSVLAALSNLSKLNIANTNVHNIIDLKHCPNLNSLNLSGCRISTIAPLQDITHLKSIDLSQTTIRDLSPLSNLKELQNVNISDTPVAHLNALSELENLNALYCSNTNVRDLSPLNGLTKLNKIYCDHSGIDNTLASAFTNENPRTLVIYDTEALFQWWNSLPIFWKAVFSKQIKIDAQPTTEQLHQIINMPELDLSGNPYMQNLLPVSRLTNLKSLNLANTEITSLEALEGLAYLESLNLNNTFISDLSPLHDMNSLRFLNIENTPVNNLMPLITDNNIEVILADSTSITRQKVVALKEHQRQVTVVYQTSLLRGWWTLLDETWKSIFREHVNFKDYVPSDLELQHVIDLQEIRVDPEFQIQTLQPLTDFIWLERLTVNNQSIRDLTPLANKEYLKELNVQNNPIISLEPIEMNTMLELLNIENTQIYDLAPLSKMNNLVTLNAGGTPVRSLKPLSNLMHLENLFINNTNVKSLSPIENIVSLKQLKIYNTKVKNRTVESLQQKRLDLNIIYY